MAWSKNVLSAVSRRHPGRPVVRFVINGLDKRTKVAREILDFADRMDPPAAKSYIRRLGDLISAANKTSVSRMGWRARHAASDVSRLFDEVTTLAENQPNAPRSRRAANE
jgi:hypothetical protein